MSGGVCVVVCVWVVRCVCVMVCVGGEVCDGVCGWWCVCG